MAQIITSNSGGGGAGASYTAGTGIEISAQNEINVDTDVVQTVGNMVDNLTGADDDHYPTAKAVADAISGGGSGDVVGPASSTDGDIVLFDGATGKIIKDSGVGLSSKLDASALSDNNYGGAWENDSTHTPTKGALYTKIHTMDVEIGNKAADNTVVKLSGNQTIAGTKTFSTSPVVPSKTAAATNTGTAIATEAQVKLVADDVATINGMISSNASSSNKLMDKNYIDDSINSVTAYYITKNAQGDQWATYAELAAASTFYSGGGARTPTRNDYTIVLADENHDNACTRYIYNSGWEYQYTVNETALSQAQLDALNSGITSGKVSTYDGYASAIAGKQDALTLPATPTQGHLVTWGADNKSLTDGGAVPAGVPSGGNNGDVLTNVSGTPTWDAPTVKSFTYPSVSDNIISLHDWVRVGKPAVLLETNGAAKIVYVVDKFVDRALWGDDDMIYASAITDAGVISVLIRVNYVDSTTATVTSVTASSVGGGLQVSPNSTITGIKYVWYGTEADYANLSQYYTDVAGDTEFHTF